MSHSIRNLFADSWANLVSALGTTTLSICLFSFAVPAAIVLLRLFIFDWPRKRKTGMTLSKIVRGTLLSWSTLIPSLIYLVAWIGLLGWSLSTTIYRDHVALLGRIGTLVSTNRTLTNENDDLLRQNKELKSAPPKTITQVIPTPEPEKKCWMSNQFGMPNSTIKGAMTATETILHCNYKIDAPFAVQVEFDRDFIPGALVLPDAGIVMGGGEGKQGRVYMAQINSPALLSNQLAIVTVYGETDQYPRALRGGIKALN